MKKVDLFLENNTAKCIHHGEHSEWKYIDRKGKRKGNKLYHYRALECKKCVRERTARYYKNNPEYQDDYRYSYNGTLRRMLAGARKRAKVRGVEFELDKEWLEQKIKQQNNRCAYSGVKFDFSRPVNKKIRHDLPSIDRIDVRGGYTKDNSAIVCSIINIMKYDIEVDDFIEYCRLVAQRVHNEDLIMATENYDGQLDSALLKKDLEYIKSEVELHE